MRSSVQQLLALALALGCAHRAQGGEASPPEAGERSVDTPALGTADCPPNALFCDGFEVNGVGEPPGTPWRDETGKSGAVVQVDAVRVFRGERSVHVLAPKGAAYRRGYVAIHQSPVFPAAAAELFGRAMIWLDAAPLAGAGQPPVHWTFIQGEGRSRDDTFNSLYRYGGQQQGGLGLMANFETTPPVRSDCWQHSASRLPVQRWACVEWRFVVASNEMQFWLDGTELTDLHVTGRASGPQTGCLSQQPLGGQWLAPPAFQSLYLGLERYQDTENDQNLWIDDVVLAKARVGCPAPTEAKAPAL